MNLELLDRHLNKYEVLVDEEVYSALFQHRTWYICNVTPKFEDKPNWNSAPKIYLMSSYTKDKSVLPKLRKRTVYLHTELWKQFRGPIPDGFTIDHINGNSLDSRLENLRCVSLSQNTANTKAGTIYSGVHRYSTTTITWFARIPKYLSKPGQTRELGVFGTAEEAAKAIADAVGSKELITKPCFEGSNNQKEKA